MKDGRTKVRSESQEYPNQGYVDAIVRKLFPDGYLIDPEYADKIGYPIVKALRML